MVYIDLTIVASSVWYISKRRLMPCVTYWTVETIEEFKYLQLMKCSQKLSVLRSQRPNACTSWRNTKIARVLPTEFYLCCFVRFVKQDHFNRLVFVLEGFRCALGIAITVKPA